MKFVRKLSSMVALLSIFVTATNVNSACVFIIHQPKLPEGASRLKKI